MPTAKIYLPKQWTDWTTWLLGLWLCLSPWTLLFEAEAAAMRNAVLLGVLIILGRGSMLLTSRPIMMFYADDGEKRR